MNIHKYPNIEKERLRQRESQEDIARLFGVTQVMYLKWEHGKLEIPVHVVRELSKRWSVSADWLIAEEVLTRVARNSGHKNGRKKVEDEKESGENSDTQAADHDGMPVHKAANPANG